MSYKGSLVMSAVADIMWQASAIPMCIYGYRTQCYSVIPIVIIASVKLLKLCYLLIKYTNVKYTKQLHRI